MDKKFIKQASFLKEKFDQIQRNDGNPAKQT